MLHGNAFLQLLDEQAPEHRGATQAGSTNWVMAMARRAVGPTRFGLRTMVSLEPWTIRGCGYPNLLATGEFCDGDSIHDRQHPHDLFMELAAQVDRPLSGALRWEAYGALVGEPALGPPAFPHRVSALPNPLSPIAHHWLDATHITFGVVTAGVYDAKSKAEMSVFNGREPDERRYDFDFAALDSVAGRVWVSSDGIAGAAGVRRASQRGGAGSCRNAVSEHGSVHDIGDISPAFWRQSFLGDDARLGGQPRVGRCNQWLDRGIERQPVGTARVVRSCRDERQTRPRSSCPRVERRFHRREAPGGLHSIL